MGFTSYDLAGDNPNPMTVAEVDALKDLVREVGIAPTVIQIGAERGCSTLAILEASPLAFILSIDIGIAEAEREHIDRAGLDNRRVVRGLGKSQDIGYAWPSNWQCDLLFIDGDHRRPGIDRDIKLWTRTVRGGGIVVFHDYIPNPPTGIRGRVAEAVDEWDKTNKDAGKSFVLIGITDRLIAFRVEGWWQE